jgi:hypothetical protein
VAILVWGSGTAGAAVFEAGRIGRLHDATVQTTATSTANLRMDL